jgi:hypothetical protein
MAARAQKAAAAPAAAETEDTTAAAAAVEQTETPAADTADVSSAPLTPELVDDTTPVADEPGGEDEKPQGDPRLDALAKLIAGESDEASGGEVATDATPLVDATGVAHEWGGDRPYVVLIAKYNVIVGGAYLSARKGDVVHLDEDNAKRGLSLDAIASLD